MKKSLHLLLLVALTLHPFQRSWGALETRVAPEKIRKLTPCALELLMQSTGASFQSNQFVQDWFLNHSIAGFSDVEDRVFGMVIRNQETEAIHIKGRKEVSRFLFNWAEVIDEQVAKPTPVTPLIPPKTKEFVKSAINFVGALTFLTIIYSNEIMHPNSWKDARFGLMINMGMSHWCWVDVWRGIKSTKLRTLLTIGSSMAGLALPALLIPEMRSGHEATLQVLKEMAVMIAASHAVSVAYFQKLIKPAEQPKYPVIAVPSRPRDLQVESQGSRNGHYFYVQFEIPGDSLTKPRFLDVILYQGDAAQDKEPELLIVRSDHPPEQIYDELVRYESERKTDN
jgi:hypothetical protein